MKGKTMSTVPTENVQKTPIITKVKSHFYNHRAKYSTAATVLAVGAFETLRVKSWNDYLEEKGFQIALGRGGCRKTSRPG